VRIAATDEHSVSPVAPHIPERHRLVVQEEVWDCPGHPLSKARSNPLGNHPKGWAVGESEPLPIAYVDKSLTPPIYRLGARSCINSRSSNARKQKDQRSFRAGPVTQHCNAWRVSVRRRARAGGVAEASRWVNLTDQGYCAHRLAEGRKPALLLKWGLSEFRR
jgi:hypothetical protein